MHPTEHQPHESQKVLLTLFVACYNEEANIAATLGEVFAALDETDISHEVIVVDDASKDGTIEAVQEFMALHPDRNMRLVARERNVGLAHNFVDTAFIGVGEYYRLICGDNVEPKETLVSIFRHLGAADLIIPYHVAPPEGRTMSRQIISRVYTSLVNLISGHSIRYYNGMAIYRRYDVMRWHTYAHGFGFQADMITRLLDQGVSFAEVPIIAYDRDSATSTALTIKNLLSVAHTLLEITVRRLAKALYGRGEPPTPVRLPASPRSES